MKQQYRKSRYLNNKNKSILWADESNPAPSIENPRDWPTLLNSYLPIIFQSL